MNNLRPDCVCFSQVFVSEWEEFEAEGEELALWLADLDVRLTEVDHLNGSTCEKLRQLQVRVCVIQINACPTAYSNESGKTVFLCHIYHFETTDGV